MNNEIMIKNIAVAKALEMNNIGLINHVAQKYAPILDDIDKRQLAEKLREIGSIWNFKTFLDLTFSNWGETDALTTAGILLHNVDNERLNISNNMNSYLDIIIFLLRKVKKAEELTAGGIDFEKIRTVIYRSNDLEIIQRFNKEIKNKIVAGFYSDDTLIQKERDDYKEAFFKLFNQDTKVSTAIDRLTNYINNELSGDATELSDYIIDLLKTSYPFFPAELLSFKKMNYSNLDLFIIELIMTRKINGKQVGQYIRDSFDLETKFFKCDFRAIEQTIFYAYKPEDEKPLIIDFYNDLFNCRSNEIDCLKLDKYLDRGKYENFLYNKGDIESLNHLMKLDNKRISDQKIADEFYNRGFTPNIYMLELLFKNRMSLDKWEKRICKQCSSSEINRFLNLAHKFERLSEINLEKCTKAILTNEDDSEIKATIIYDTIFIPGADLLLLVDELEKMSRLGCQKAQIYLKIFKGNEELQGLYFEAFIERGLFDADNPHQDSKPSRKAILFK